MKTILPFIITILTVLTFSSCRQDNVSPIRNVRFDPKLLTPLKAAGACTNYSYLTGSENRNLGTIHTGQIVVAFKDNVTGAQRDEVLGKYGFVAGVLNQSANQSGMMFTVSLINGLNCAQAEQAIQVLAKDIAIKYAGPFFWMDNKQAIGLSNEVMVKADAGSVATLKKLADSYQAKVIGPLGADTYLVQIDKNSMGNALQFVNTLKGQKGIAHATPDFVLAL